jgi:type IV secretion system protein VirB5
MFRRSILPLISIAVIAFGLCRPAAAQWAVIDVASIAQLIQEYEVLQQQLTTVQANLDQARQQYSALTGGRGMDRLLSGTARNYLPATWTDLSAALQGTGGAYGPLASNIQDLVTANAILSAQDLSRLSAAERMHLDAARRSAALLQALTRQELDTTSARFASLQQLIDAIPIASDPKAALDLQARIASEQTMLSNEGAKLQVLYQIAQAQEWAADQQRREQAIADLGSLRNLPPMGLR